MLIRVKRMKYGQSIITIYAKQTQFTGCSRDTQMTVTLVKTRSYNNEQRTMNNERLCKTNPIKPNLVRCPVRRSFSEDGSLGEGGFKRGSSAAILQLCYGGL